MSQKVIAIAAVARNGVIGNGLELPWNIPEDMKFFRESTKGQVVIMGRKTFDSLKKALPNRANYVITRDKSWSAPGVRVFQDLGAAIQDAKNDPQNATRNIFVIGGAQIYGESFPYLDEVWLTEIEQEVSGDVFFPAFESGVFVQKGFKKVESRAQTEKAPQNEQYFFCRYVKI